jgi:hypothetical protein
MGCGHLEFELRWCSYLQTAFAAKTAFHRQGKAVVVHAVGKTPISATAGMVVKGFL